MDAELIPGTYRRNHVIVCDCPYPGKRDIGGLGNQENHDIHIFICDTHKTTMTHHIKTGKIAWKRKIPILGK